jgi:hypothetical protein
MTMHEAWVAGFCFDPICVAWDELLLCLLSPGLRWQKRGCSAEEFGCHRHTC